MARQSRQGLLAGRRRCSCLPTAIPPRSSRQGTMSCRHPAPAVHAMAPARCELRVLPVSIPTFCSWLRRGQSQLLLRMQTGGGPPAAGGPPLAPRSRLVPRPLPMAPAAARQQAAAALLGHQRLGHQLGARPPARQIARQPTAQLQLPQQRPRQLPPMASCPAAALHPQLPQQCPLGSRRSSSSRSLERRASLHCRPRLQASRARQRQRLQRLQRPLGSAMLLPHPRCGRTAARSKQARASRHSRSSSRSRPHGQSQAQCQARVPSPQPLHPPPQQQLQQHQWLLSLCSSQRLNLQWRQSSQRQLQQQQQQQQPMRQPLPRQLLCQLLRSSHRPQQRHMQQLRHHRLRSFLLLLLLLPPMRRRRCSAVLRSPRPSLMLVS